MSERNRLQFNDVRIDRRTYITPVVDMPVCAHCGCGADLKCASCGLVHYCSKQHQKLAWRSHKNDCVAYKIAENARLGRYLVANRDVRAGEVIMKKTPLVAGPKMITVPICLGCHRKLDEDFVRCSNCSWGVCSAICEASKWHVHECKALSKAGIKPQMAFDGKSASYALILPLRALLLRSINRKQFNELISLQSHIESNLSKPIYTYLAKSLIPLLKRVNLSGLNGSNDDVDPLQVCSIFDTNAFEVRNTQVNIRAVYPLVSFLSHDCTPNTRHVCDDDFAMSVIATKELRRGERICTTYTQTLWPTLSRRAHLRRVKHFDCDCARCSDPTELGTFAGSLRCQECRHGLLLSVNPLEQQAAWKCNQCGHSVAACQVETLNAQIRAEILAAGRSPQEFEELLVNYAHLLHERNTHALEIKYALVQLYAGAMSATREDCQRRRVELCQELLKVSSVLEPGDSSFSEALEKARRAAEMALQARTGGSD